jgi:hypothetical protein
MQHLSGISARVAYKAFKQASNQYSMSAIEQSALISIKLLQTATVYVNNNWISIRDIIL